MHSGLVMVLPNVLLEAGVPKSTILFEMRGLRSTDRTRPGDVVALNFFGLDRHLVIDAVVSTVYRNCILQERRPVLYLGMLPNRLRTESWLIKILLHRCLQCMVATTCLFLFQWRTVAELGLMAWLF